MFDAAHAAVASGDWARALAALLDVWRATRDPDLADLIDRVSARASRPYDVVFPSSLRHDYMRWNRRITQHDILDLPALLVGFRWMGLGNLEPFAAWPDDPRIASKLVEQLPTVPAYQSAYATLLARFRDPRTRPALQAAGSPWNEIEIPAHRPVDITSITAAVDARLAAEAAHAADKRRRFARVYEHPTDLAERAVLADWLQEHEDPRGDFIALQLAPPTRANLKAAKNLLRAHRRAFLGDLREAIYGGRFRFVNGFLEHCDIDLRYLHGSEESPQWATLRHVHLHRDGERGRTFVPFLPKLVALESLGGMGLDTFLAVARGAVPTVTRIAHQLAGFDGAHRELARELPGLPNLRELATRLEPNAWFVGGGAWNRLSHATISCDLARAGDWFVVFMRSFAMRRFTLHDGDWTFHFTRDRLAIRGIPSEPEWRWDRRDQRALLRAGLQSLPARVFDRITVKFADGIEPELARLRR